MSRPDTEVVNAGIADNPVKAVEAAEDLKKEDISLLFVCTSMLVGDSYNPFLYFRF